MTVKFSEQEISVEKVLQVEGNNPIAYWQLSDSEECIDLGLDRAYMFLFLEKTRVQGSPQDSRIYFSIPGQQQSIQLSPEDRAHVMAVDTDFVGLFMSNSHLLEAAMTSYIIFPKLQDLYRLLLIDFSLLGRAMSATTKDQQAIRLRTRLILKMIDDLIGRGTAVASSLLPPVLHAFNSLLNQHIVAHKEVSYYAQELHISRGHLNMLSKKYLGMSTKAYIDQRVLLESKSLLIHSSLTTKEITFKLGFSCMASFSHFLKSKTGMTSKQIRKQG
jgi:AraC-like DNA-binding protein